MKTLKYTLKPYWKENTVIAMDIAGSVDVEVVKGKEPAMDFCSDAWGKIVPFPEYQQLTVCDDEGEIPCEIKQSPSNWGGINYKGLYFQRDITGTLKWSYKIYPRVLPEGYVSSPYYDFRNEPFGLSSSGCFSFILPYTQDKLDFDLHWDMSEMPKEARGIWSYGNGDVRKTLTPWECRFTYFACGLMNSEEIDDFGIYWFGEPTFPIRKVTKRLAQLFEYMRKFFKDDEPMYHIILRRDPFEKSNGGSVARRAFISGYSATGTVDVEQWFCTLAHEMVHNWIMGDDTITGTMTWYTEGIAEYYSAVLPYRQGLVDAEYTVLQLNKKGKERYLDNVYREMPNLEIPKIQWAERSAQTVPYGRGFVYLSNVEAQLRRNNNGSIDELAPYHGLNNMLKEDDWKQFINERLGESGVQEYEAMKLGKVQVPDADGFGDAFTVEEDNIELDGKVVKSYKWVLR